MQKQKIRVVVGVEHKGIVAVVSGRGHHAAYQLGKIGVGDVGDDDAQQMGAPGLERACSAIGDVVQLGNGLLHAGGRLGMDTPTAVDDQRDG